MDIKEINGRGLTNYELSIIESSFRDGGIVQRKRRSPRTLDISYQVIGSTRSEIRQNIDELNGIFNVNHDVPIVFPDESDKTYFGQPESNSEGQELFFMHEGSFRIVCPDPDKIGQQKQRTVDGNSFTYRGTSPTFPIITVDFSESASSFEVSNQDGERVKVNYDFQNGDVLELNFSTQKISINGNVQMTALAWTISKWFSIKPGENTLTSTQPADMTYKVRWQ